MEINAEYADENFEEKYEKHIETYGDAASSDLQYVVVTVL